MRSAQGPTLVPRGRPRGGTGCRGSGCVGAGRERHGNKAGFTLVHKGKQGDTGEGAETGSDREQADRSRISICGFVAEHWTVLKNLLLEPAKIC